VQYLDSILQPFLRPRWATNQTSLPTLHTVSNPSSSCNVDRVPFYYYVFPSYRYLVTLPLPCTSLERLFRSQSTVRANTRHAPTQHLWYPFA